MPDVNTQVADRAIPPDASATATVVTVTKRTKRNRKNDRYLFKNPLPLELQTENTSRPITAILSPTALFSALRATLAIVYSWSIFSKHEPPYEGVLVGDSGCVWLTERNSDKVKKWENAFYMRTTVPQGTGTLHAEGLGLWRGGFFGKAILSRGEPTWWKRLTENQGGGVGGESLASRRRAQRIAQRRAQPQPTVADAPQQEITTPATSDDTIHRGVQSILVADAGQQEEVSTPATSDDSLRTRESTPVAEGLGWGILTIDPERYQLTPEEAFFLAHGVGLLGVKQKEEGPNLRANQLWSKLRRQSTPLSAASVVPSPISSSAAPISVESLCDEFAVRFAAYHFYKSRGWVVKSGIKFGTDFVLYRMGPIFRHSDYAVVVLPSLSSGHDVEQHSTEHSRTWVWALSVNRVCAQVKKRVLFCHVVVPADITREELEDPACIRRFTVWDVCMGRWVPERTRD